MHCTHARGRWPCAAKARTTLSNVPGNCADPVSDSAVRACRMMLQRTRSTYSEVGNATSHSKMTHAPMRGCVLQQTSCHWPRTFAADLLNTPAAYVHLFGREAQLKLIDRISHFERRRAELLSELPPHLQQVITARQSSAGEEPGAEKWVFPDAILDEAATIAQWDAP